MSLSQLYEAVGHGWDERGGCSQAPNHGGEIEASVEAVGEFGEVAGQMLGANRMVGSLHGVLDVAEHGIDPDECPASLPSPGAAGYQRLMGAAGLRGCGKAAQAIGADVGAGR